MKKDTINIQLLIQGCKQSNRNSQRRLFEYFAEYALSISLRYTKNRAEAEEIINTGFLKIFTHIDQYDSAYPFRAWLRRIMINTAIDYHRANKPSFTLLELKPEIAKVFADNWHIAGCPVNGPAIKANGSFVAVAWYSMPQEKAEIKIAFSKDSGKTFQTPIRIDNGNPLGRIAIELLADNTALVSWLENTAENAEIRAVKVNLKGKIGSDFLVSKTDPARDSGFPVMAKSGNRIIFAWTHVDDLTHIKTAVLKL